MTSSGSVIAASVTKNTPCGKSSTSSAAACSASRVFPVPPGPVSVTTRTSARRRSSTTSATSRSRPTRGVDCTGRFVGRFSSVRSGGNRSGDPRAPIRTGAAARSGPSVGARRDPRTRTPLPPPPANRAWCARPAPARRAPPSRSSRHDGCRRRRNLRGRRRLGGVDPHPHAELAPVRPRVAGEGALPVARRADRVSRPGESDEEGVTLRVDLVPSEPGEGLPQEPSVIIEHHGVRLSAEISKQPSRALDIGEQEGDGSGCALAHGRMMPRRPCPELRFAPAGSAPVGIHRAGPKEEQP